MKKKVLASLCTLFLFLYLTGSSVTAFARQIHSDEIVESRISYTPINELGTSENSPLLPTFTFREERELYNLRDRVSQKRSTWKLPFQRLPNLNMKKIIKLQIIGLFLILVMYLLNNLMRSKKTKPYLNFVFVLSFIVSSVLLGIYIYPSSVKAAEQKIEKSSSLKQSNQFLQNSDKTDIQADEINLKNHFVISSWASSTSSPGGIDQADFIKSQINGNYLLASQAGRGAYQNTSLTSIRKIDFSKDWEMKYMINFSADQSNFDGWAVAFHNQENYKFQGGYASNIGIYNYNGTGLDNGVVAEFDFWNNESQADSFSDFSNQPNTYSHMAINKIKNKGNPVNVSSIGPLDNTWCGVRWQESIIKWNSQNKELTMVVGNKELRQIIDIPKEVGAANDGVYFTIGTGSGVSGTTGFTTELKYEVFNMPSLGKNIIRYVDEKGNSLQKDKVIEGSVGSSYDTTTDEYLTAIPGYELDSSKLPTDAIGFFEEEIKEIVYSYTRISEPVIVHYQDEFGNKIHESKTIVGKYGESYDATTEEYKLDIPGYKLDETKLPSNGMGFFSDIQQEITYVYKVTVQAIGYIEVPAEIKLYHLNSSAGEEIVGRGKIKYRSIESLNNYKINVFTNPNIVLHNVKNSSYAATMQVYHKGHDKVLQENEVLCELSKEQNEDTFYLRTLKEQFQFSNESYQGTMVFKATYQETD